jgi:hypothetical protein
MSRDITSLLNGNTSPVIRIDREGVYLDDVLLPVLIADDEIEVTTLDGQPGSGGKTVRLSLLTFGPVIVDNRLKAERINNEVEVIRAPKEPVNPDAV